MDFSLRKTKALRSSRGAGGGKKPSPFDDVRQKKNVQISLPSLDKKNQEKIGKLIQRRMSVHQLDGAKLAFAGDAQGAPALPMHLLGEQRPPVSQAVGQTGGQAGGQAGFQAGFQAGQRLQSGGGGAQAGQGLPSDGGGAQAEQGLPSGSGGAQARDQAGQSGGAPQAAPLRRADTLSKINLHDPSVIRMLQDPSFDADSFISSRLADSTASDIEKFSSSLAQLHEKVASDIRATSSDTYRTLIATTEDLAATRSELKLLRSAVTELLGITTQMKATAEKRIELELAKTDAGTAQPATSRARDRSSILVLEKMWANEMSSLFRHVEGAQKFVAAIPGRHVITESGRWYELNSATFKTLQPAHIFILNDVILIATRKRRNNTLAGSTGSNDSIQNLIADQCWPLREVQLVEIDSVSRKTGSPDSKVYTINIRYNSLSYFYQTDRLDHYDKIRSGYKKAKNELKDVLELENEKQKRLRDSMTLLSNYDDRKRSSINSKTNSISITTQNDLNLLKSLNSKVAAHSRSRSLNSNGPGATDASTNLKLLKKIDEATNEVDYLISQEHYQDAIKALQDLEAELHATRAHLSDDEVLYSNLISLNIAAKRDEIVKNLISLVQLDKRNLSLPALEQILAMLVGLGFSKLSKNLFLNNRSSYILSLIGKIENTNIAEYLVEISIVRVQCIKSTIDLYKNVFTERDQASSISTLIEWCINEIKIHIAQLKSIINGVKLTTANLQSAIVQIHRQVAELKASGVNVEYLFDDFYRSINVE